MNNYEVRNLDCTEKKVVFIRGKQARSLVRNPSAAHLTSVFVLEGVLEDGDDLHIFTTSDPGDRLQMAKVIADAGYDLSKAVEQRPDTAAPPKPPAFLDAEREAIISHLLWSKDSPHLRRLLDGPSSALTVRLNGPIEGGGGIVITLKIGKSEAKRAIDHPFRQTQQELAKYGYLSAMSRVFTEEPTASVSG